MKPRSGGWIRAAVMETMGIAAVLAVVTHLSPGTPNVAPGRESSESQGDGKRFAGELTSLVSPDVAWKFDRGSAVEPDRESFTEDRLNTFANLLPRLFQRAFQGQADAGHR